MGWAASEAKTHGPDGMALLARVTELVEETIRCVLAELEDGERLERGQVRRAGGQLRPVVAAADPSLRLRCSGPETGCPRSRGRALASIALLR